MIRSKWQWLLMAVLLAVTCVISACSGQGEKIKLSEMDDDALTVYLETEGIVIPDGVEISTVRKMIRSLEENPEVTGAPYGWVALAELHNELRLVVKGYYGITD